MLLPLLTIAATLLGSWIFTVIISGISNTGESAQPFIILNKQVSLWSLVLFLLFPPSSTASQAKHLADER